MVGLGIAKASMEVPWERQWRFEDGFGESRSRNRGYAQRTYLRRYPRGMRLRVSECVGTHVLCCAYECKIRGADLLRSEWGERNGMRSNNYLFTQIRYKMASNRLPYLGKKPTIERQEIPTKCAKFL